MKWIYLITGGFIGFIIGATIDFIKDFDADYEFDEYE